MFDHHLACSELHALQRVKASLLAAKAKILVTAFLLPTTLFILLNMFNIPPSLRRFKDIEMIVYKPPTLPYI